MWRYAHKKSWGKNYITKALFNIVVFSLEIVVPVPPERSALLLITAGRRKMDGFIIGWLYYSTHLTSDQD